MLQVGAHAPSFQLRGLDNKVCSLEEILARGPAVISFFKISCPVCQMTFPYLERMHANAAASGLRFFGVSQDGPEATLEFNREFGITFPTLLDAASAGYPASNGFGISHVPSTFLVEKDGAISWALDGFARRELEHLGERAGVKPFRRGDYAPEWRAG